MNARNDLENILALVAEKVNWKHFEISADFNHEKGNGFLGELFLAAIINKETKEKLDLAIKKAFKSVERRDEVNIPVAFRNEICFYETIAPTLIKFKNAKRVSESYDFIPKFFVSTKKDFEESLVMQNLTTIGYNIIGREHFLDQEHVEFIFKTYGKYHALSFAFKDQHYEDYKKMMNNVVDFFATFKKTEGFSKVMESALSDALNSVNKKIKDDCKRYLENPYDIFVEAGKYKGKHSCVVHGDCWSNNMMFKYKNSKIENMKLIDFQLVKDGTPIYDLSYFLYAGGLKETFQNLNPYLKIYHNSFVKACKELGSDPQKLYPFEALKEDWKKYSKWGIMMALIINKVKNLGHDDVQKMTDDSNFMEQLKNSKVDGEKQAKYEERISDIIEDVYKKGFLKFYN